MCIGMGGSCEKLATYEFRKKTFNLAFRVRSEYFDAMDTGEKDVEYRRNIEFWQLRLYNIFKNSNPKITPEFWHYFFYSNLLFEIDNLEELNIILVVTSGKRVNRWKASKIARIKTPDYFSEQGRKDVDTDVCFTFHFGEKLDVKED